MTNKIPPTVDYWGLWTDADGLSWQARCAFTHFELSSIQPQADAQWIGSKAQDQMTTFVTVLPAGWTGDWHENPKPQWIIPLSGRWSVESMDGQRVEMGCGKISFGEDQKTKPKGERRAMASSGPSNLESPWAHRALQAFYVALHRGNVPAMDKADL